MHCADLSCRSRPCCLSALAVYPGLSGLVRAEEMHAVQHKAAVRLERLQHQRAWNITKLKHQQAAKAAAEGPNTQPVSSTGCTSADTLQHLAAAATDPSAAAGGSKKQPETGGGDGVGAGGQAAGERPHGVMLADLRQVRSGMSELRQRVTGRL